MGERESDSEHWFILGAGYVGTALALRLLSQAHFKGTVTLTRRRAPVGAPEPQNPIHSFLNAGRARLLNFDLFDPESWDSLLSVFAPQTRVVWTFPAALSHGQVKVAERFFMRLGLHEYGVVVLGTSGSLECNGPPGSVYDDSTPTLSADPRAQAEQKLCAAGATIVRLSGIFGPHRSPLSWLQRGLIPSSQKIVNLIHVEDIVESLIFILRGMNQYRLKGRSLLLTNNDSHTWEHWVERLKTCGHLPGDFFVPTQPVGSESRHLRASHFFSEVVFTRNFIRFIDDFI